MRHSMTKKYYENKITNNIINDFLDYSFKNKNEILNYVDKIDNPRLNKLYQYLELMKNNDSLNRIIKKILLSPTLIISNDLAINLRHIHGLFEYYIYKNDLLIDYDLYLKSYSSYSQFSSPYYNVYIDDEL